MDDAVKEHTICFVTDYSILIGGKERQLLEILKFLSSAGYPFRVLSLSDRGLLYQKLLDDYALQVHLIDRKVIGTIKAIQTLRSFIRNNKNIKLYHTFDSLSTGYLLVASLLQQIKIINGSIRHAGVEKSFNYLLDCLLLQLSSAIVANSYAGLKYYHIKTGFVLYNAIDSRRFQKTTGDAKSVIMVANFSIYKDHASFFEATAKLIKEGIIKAVGLVGDGPFLVRWKKYVKQIELESNYTFYGHTAKVEQILCDYGIGILCSTRKYREGISNSILEYMSSGLLVIASDVGATKEIILNKKNGLLYEVQNSANLSVKIKWAVEHSDACEQMVANAYETLKDKFDYSKNLEELLSFYERVIN